MTEFRMGILINCFNSLCIEYGEMDKLGETKSKTITKLCGSPQLKPWVKQRTYSTMRNREEDIMCQREQEIILMPKEPLRQNISTQMTSQFKLFIFYKGNTTTGCQLPLPRKYMTNTYMKEATHSFFPSLQILVIK